MKFSFAPTVVINRLVGVGWAIVLAFLFVLAVDSFITDCGGDSCLFEYVAKGILQGEIPYLDRWDNKGPLQYLLNAVGLAINGIWGMWAIQGLFLLVTVYFAFSTLRRVFGILPTLCALAVFLALFAKFNPPGNFTEQYGLLFQFLTLYLFIRSEKQNESKSSPARFAFLHLGIGVLGAASFLFKPNLVALWIVIGIYWLFRRGYSLRKLAWAIAGGASILILFAGLFQALGALEALWDAVFVFNFALSDASLQERLGVVWYLTTVMFPISLLVIAGWCIGTFRLTRSQPQSDNVQGLLVICLVLLPLEIVGLSLSGYGFMHYFLSALPVFTLLVAFLVWFVLEQRLFAPTLLGFALLVGVTAFSSPSSSFSQLAEKYGAERALPGTSESPLAIRLRRIIQGSTQPDETILVWGKAVWINLLSDRDAPTRFFYEVPLVKPHYTNQTILDEFLSDVKGQRPKLIIDKSTSRLPPLASAQRAGWRPARRFAIDVNDFQPFFDFVEANYLAVDSSPSFTIYALKQDDFKISAPEQGRLIIHSHYDIYLDGKTLTYVRRQCANNDAAKRFILHVIPVDKSVIGGNEQHTMDFSFIEGEDWYVGESCVVSRELPEYAIAYIRTGQYDISRSRHEWVSEYHLSRPN